MILPDVNVLVFAFRREGDRHDRYHAWLEQALAGPEELAFTDPVATGFVRVVTNPRIFADPAPTPAAVEFVDVVRRCPAARSVASSSAAWRRFGELVAADRQVRGNLVPDAWLASLALVHGARVATADKGFARFGVDHFDPAGPSS